MVFVSFAAAALALNMGARAPKADSPVVALFRAYCDVKAGTTQPYCGDAVPDNIAALESLQQLALGVGGALQAAVGIYAKSKTDFSAMRAFIAKNQQLKPPPAAKVEPDALINVVLLYDQTIAKMATASRALAD